MHNMTADMIEHLCADYTAGYSVEYLARKHHRDRAHIQEIIENYLDE